MTGRWRAAALGLSSILALGIAACGSDAPQLAGTSWTLVEAPGVELVADAPATVRFTETDLNGSGACNTYRGTYTAEGGVIDVSPLASTLIGCEPAIAAQETAVFARLSEAQTYGIDERRLELDGPPGTLIFEPAD